MKLHQHAVAVYREEGVTALCRKSLRYVSSFVLLPLGKLYTRFIPPLPKLRKRKRVRGVSARFEISNYVEFRRLVFKKGDVPLEAFLAEIRDGDVVFDVGANIGMYSCLADRAGDDTTVYAFEPHPANLISLENNVRLNDSSVRVLDVALSDSNGESEFFAKSISERGEGIGSISSETRSRDIFTESITVETRRGDDLISDDVVPVPDVLKIDVEGAEMAVLAGFEETLANNECRAVLIEVHSPPNTARDVETHMQRYGYDVETLWEGDHQIHLIARL